MIDFAFERRFDAEQWMVGDVEAEHVFLRLETLVLVEFDVRNRDPLVVCRCCANLGGGGVVPAAEQAHHALVALTATFDRDIENRFERAQETESWVTETVECSGLDQRFNGSLVEYGFRYTFREVVEIGELAVRLTFGDQLLDQARTDVADGRQSECDCPRATDRERNVVGDECRWDRVEVDHGSVDVGRQHLDSCGAAVRQVDGGLVEVRLDARQ